MERVDLLIKNRTVIFREGARLANVAIHQGKIAAILQPNLVPDAVRVIDATGKHVDGARLDRQERCNGCS